MPWNQGSNASVTKLPIQEQDKPALGTARQQAGMILVGACLATGDRIFAAGSENCFAIPWLFLLDFRAYNHGSKGPQKHKTYCDNIRNLEKGALEKGYLHKIVRNWLSNSRQFATIFAPLLWCTKRHTGNFAQIWRAICDKFAQRPLCEGPLLGISDNRSFAILSFTPILVGSGPVWRQDLALLSL